MRLPHLQEKPKKIIAVDFDGTLVKNKYPFCENPNIELIEFIKRNRDKYTWVLWTMRENEQLIMALNYLKTEFDLEFDYVNENTKEKIAEYGNKRKVYADYYIDDHNISEEYIYQLEN